MTRLVNDIQWRYTKTEARRGYSKQITKRTELVFTASVFVFAAVLVLIVSGNHDLNHPILMAFVGAAGAFGATFSMMTTLRRHLDGCTFDDLKLNRSWGLILARVLVGIGASFVLYFAVSSALLSGEAFPALPLVNGEGGATPGQDFAKLFIWSFISGFSEKLIPSVLARTEGQAGERDQSRPKDEDRSTTPRDRHAEAQPLQGAGMSPPAAAS